MLGANERINVACIGVGGKGDGDTNDAAKCGGNIVALCDVDANTLSKKAQKFPDAKQFKDFRKLFAEMEKDIDAVTVSTPDHLHGLITATAMRLGKHVYCQKPLVQTVYEARLMRRLAKDKKVATQMGNQGSAGGGLRRGSKSFRRVSLVPCTNCMFGPTVRSGRKASTDPRARIRFRKRWIGTCGWARRLTGHSISECIIRLVGAAGMISVLAPWATWPATQ